jgi:hypothetical protein
VTGILMNIEQLMEETRVMRGNQLQCQFVHHKSHILDLGLNPFCCDGKAAATCLSYGMVIPKTQYA